MMRKTLIAAGAAAAGAGLAYLLDPDRGRSRRVRLMDQTRARIRRGAGSVREQVDYQRGVARGLAHKVTEPLRPERSYDDTTLLQKVRSEALGPLMPSSTVDVRVSDGGIMVEGSVGSEEERARLLDSIRRVEGVHTIEDRLRVNSNSG